MTRRAWHPARDEYVDVPSRPRAGRVVAQTAAMAEKYSEDPNGYRMSPGEQEYQRRWSRRAIPQGVVDLLDGGAVGRFVAIVETTKYHVWVAPFVYGSAENRERRWRQLVGAERDARIAERPAGCPWWDEPGKELALGWRAA